MSGGGRWGDLGLRVVSALVLAAVAAAALTAGGTVLAAFLAALAAAGLWEAWRLSAAEAPDPVLPLAVGLIGFGAVLVGLWLPGWLYWAPAAVPVALGALMLRRNRLSFALFSAALMLAVGELAALRAAHGVAGFLFPVAVVIATDVAGYFGGRLIGGPRLAPAISPGKTWSGAAAGWLAAAAVALALAPWLGLGAGRAAALGLALSMAAQAGDLAESALKRRAGVKDSSALIPGHGGVLDRFDGLIGAAVALWLLQLLGLGLPAVGS